MAIDENYFRTDNPMKQNSVEDILAPNEKILQRLKPNKKVLLLEALFKGLPVVLLWVAIDTFILITLFNTGAFNDNPMMIPFIIAFFALHLLPLWLYMQVLKC